MKAHRLIKVAAVMILPVYVMLMTAGCKYDVAEPMWEKDVSAGATPVISQIEPAQVAAAGVNTITIHGENFAVAPDTNYVYFDNIPADVISSSATSITVRRPDLVTDMSTIKVVANNALVVAKFGPYGITSVVEVYGSFLENLELRSVCVDENENLYVTESASRFIWKITPGGEKTVIDTSTRAVTGARYADGWLYLLEQNRTTEKLNVATGELVDWHRLSSNRQLRYGDFDNNGYFYTGGFRIGMYIIAPDSTSSQADYYTTTDSIFAVRYYNGYIYVAAGGENGRAIWRHSVDANGNMGAQEKVIDWAEHEQLSQTGLISLEFSSEGLMFIGNDSSDPLFSYNLDTKELDYFYKDILPSYCKAIYWGSGTYLYMIRGDNTLGEEWNLYRVDMGTTSAPHYGG